MLITGIPGETGSGMTTIVNEINSCLKKGDVAVLSQDSYYHDNRQLPLAERQEINFDHPDSIEYIEKQLHHNP